MSLKFNVFDIVREHEPIEKSQIIKEAKFNKRGGEALINVVTALGLLKCIDKKYYLTGIIEIEKFFLTLK